MKHGSNSGKKFHSKYVKQFQNAALIGRNPRTGDSPTWIEKFIATYLSKNKIKYEREYDILGRYFDFYLPELDILIEAHGDYWHGNPLIYHREEGGKRKNLTTINNSINDIFKRCIAKTRNSSLLVFYESAVYEENIKKGLEEIIKQKNDNPEEWIYIEILK